MIHTNYERLSDEQLGDLFHSAYWDSPAMTLEDKVAACQEIVNRDALSHGAQPCEVVTEHMTGTSFGYYSYSDGRIHVNSNVLDQGVMVDENGNTAPFSGSNAETLDTLFHENYHAYSAQLTEALENMDSELSYNRDIVADAVKRGIDIDAVRAADTIYVSSDTSYDVYRVQPSEKEAFNAGEKGAAAVFVNSQARLGNDPSYQAYASRLANADSFRTSIDNLRAVTGDKDFDKTLEEQAKDIYFNDHTQDSAFVHGTTESRAMARSILESTQGAQLTNELAQYGVHNTHSSDILSAQAAQNLNGVRTTDAANLAPENQNDSQLAKAAVQATENTAQTTSEAAAQAQGANTEGISFAEIQAESHAPAAAEASGGMSADDDADVGNTASGATSASDTGNAVAASDEDSALASTGDDFSTSDSGGNRDDDADSLSDA